MKLSLPRGQQWFALVVIAAFVLYLGNRLWTHREIDVSWREEVQLADGSRIWVERKKITGMRPGINRGIKADQIVIPGEGSDVIWEFPLAPMILERGTEIGRWVVIAIPIYCEEHYQYRSPMPPYIQFNYVNGEWSHKHVSPEWYGKRANLLGDFERSFEQFLKREGKAFTTKQIGQFNDRIFDAANEQIVVEANYKSNCYERE